MTWERVTQYVELTAASGLHAYRTVVGWRCTQCQHVHWESEERPGRPDGGCWLCGGRDEEVGKDAPASGPTGREVLGKILPFPERP
jgi:hypothetical protein